MCWCHLLDGLNIISLLSNSHYYHQGVISLYQHVIGGKFEAALYSIRGKLYWRFLLWGRTGKWLSLLIGKSTLLHKYVLLDLVNISWLELLTFEIWGFVVWSRVFKLPCVKLLKYKILLLTWWIVSWYLRTQTWYSYGLAYQFSEFSIQKISFLIYLVV